MSIATFSKNTEVKEKEEPIKADYVKPKIVYNIEDVELKKIEVEKGIFLRILQCGENKTIDLRKFYKGYPTKRGIRINYKVFLDLLDNLTK